MPVVFRSKPSVARASVSASSAMDSDMAREDVLSAVARLRRELVRCTWVEVSDSRIGIVEEGGLDDGEEEGLGVAEG